ncbi:transcriptional repressor [Candidatus Peribacteria bacterium]|nr:transcriptional repressor [Candidatus Peribacteria bacterium]
MDFRDYILRAYAEHNWRLTAAVRNLITIFEQSTTLLSANELTAMLRSRGHHTDITTVYRILERLQELRCVTQIDTGFIRTTAYQSTGMSHHFLLCTSCGQAEEITLNYKEGIARQLAEEKQFSLDHVEMTFYGLCQACKA